ncbi:MAG: rane protein [Pseudobdellovibrio sp.]|nr:rane protein [Pseudobdellovibrio sp.]
MNKIEFIPQKKFGAVLVLFLLLGVKYRFAFVMLVALIFILILNYLYLQAIAKNFSLKVEPLKSVFEKETARMNLAFRNLSHFSPWPFQLNFAFAGAVNSLHSFVVSDEVAGGGSLRTGFNLECNNGMGLYEIKNFNVVIGDVFSVFRFKISYDVVATLEVRPRIEALPAVATRGSKYSELYGQHEIESRGLSVNFSNLRPYVFGDSVRHIAWRPTAKHGSLIVKEFERMVNTDATVILNLNPTMHIGMSGLNTWETAKDITLSLVSQMLSAGNSVEFVYNYGVIEKATGPDQFLLIAKALIEHDMLKASDNEHSGRTHVDDPFGTFAGNIVPGSTLVYILPVNYPHLRDSVQRLAWLSREKVEVVLVMVNPLTIWPEFRTVDPDIQDFDKTAKINKLLAELQAHQVRVYFADMGGPLVDHFREKPLLTENLTPPKFARAKAGQ